MVDSHEQISYIKIGNNEHPIDAVTLGGKTKNDFCSSKQELKTGQTVSYRNTNVDWDAGAADVKALKGNTVAWNQLVPATFSSETTTNGITLTPLSKGVYLVSGTTTQGGNFNFSNSLSVIAGHKYYFGYSTVTSSTTNVGVLYFRDTTHNEEISHLYETYSTIATPQSSCTALMYFNFGLANVSISGRLAPMLVDLTLLYGSSISGMTDAQILAKFESEFPGYHEYNVGELISNDTKELETVGFNLWDEEWENGGILTSNGLNANDGDRIRSKNYIPVIGGSVYYLKTPVGSGDVFYYDANKNFLEFKNSANNKTFTAPSNACFVRFRVGGSQSPVISYNNDICINFSDSSKNGTYEPYEKHTLPLNLNSFDVIDASGNTITITGGLKSAGNVYDEIVGNKYIKRVGSVDNLGALEWTYTSGYFDSFNIPGLRTTWTYLGDGLTCSKYVSTKATAWTFFGDKEIGSNNNQSIRIQDTSYSDAATFKASLSGVMLTYELATPIIYELVSPLVTEYPVDKNGTERAVYENETDVHAPLVADIQYGVNNNDTAANIAKIANMAKEIEDLLATI